MAKAVENYVLEEVIGSGQYGKVYRARDSRGEGLVAVKAMKLEKFRETPKLQEFMLNEVHTLSRVDNPHVVRFIECIKTGNHVYLVYEYCSGGTLEQLIARKKFLSEAKALRVLQHILNAFRSLTRANILHRDLKPGNILLHEGLVKVADFGFCKSVGSQGEMTNTMVGSPIYMAPQVLKGLPYTTKADIWSLGVVLFECLFGYCPYEDKSIAKLIGLIEHSKQLPIPRHINPISERTEELLRAMLCLDAKKRITWAALFALDFSSERPPSTSLPRKRPEKENQTVSGPALAPFVLLRNRVAVLVNALNTCLELSLDSGQAATNWLVQRITDMLGKIVEELATARKGKSESAEVKRFGQLVKREWEQFREVAQPALEGSFEKALLDYAEELARDEDRLVHANQVLDCVLLDELFENFLEKEGSLGEQRYFRELGECSRSMVRGLVGQKLRCARSRFQ